MAQGALEVKAGLWLLRILLLAGLSVDSAAAQPAVRSVFATAAHDSVTLVPNPRFADGSLHRFMLGNTFRSFWIGPIRVEIADLGGIRGGLEAMPRGDSASSRPFQFQAADGRSFGFRALVKDATLDWPERQRTRLASNLAMDQISGTLPAGVLLVSALEKAAGLITADVAFVVLPDDPRLGKWREEFANTPGILEQRLRGTGEILSAVPGAAEFVSSGDLYERLKTDGSSRVDARAFLTARLIDLLVGDWDRHESQWTWARFDEATGRRWVPIAYDRDWAFTRLDGLVWGLARLAQPKFRRFDGRLSGLAGLSQRSMPLDRRLLTELERPAWDSTVSALVASLTDNVIAAAVGQLPAGLDRERIAWLIEVLKQRRDQLPGVADAFYRDLSGVVEVWATEGPDRISLQRESDGALRVSVERGSEGGRWVRRFVSAETSEVRVYSLGGADVIDGSNNPGPIRVRIVPDSGGGPKRFKPFNPEVMLRDWGGSFGIAPWIDYWTDAGFVLGGGPSLTRYGFRRIPFASRLTARAAYTTGMRNLNADFTGDFRFEHPGRRLLLRGAALGSDPIRYFGQGNETTADSDNSSVVRRQTYRLEPALVLGGDKVELSLGAVLASYDADTERPSRAVTEQPYGFAKFTEVGALGRWELDLRDDPGYPTRGIRARVQGRFFPAVADVVESFGVIEGELSGYATAGFLPTTPTLALRVGASKGWGQTPFFEGPTIGGRRSVRGLITRRYLGDAALSGSAELRLNLGRSPGIPGEWGVYGLADVGRVYRDGESSDRWHRGGGGGLWLALMDRKNTLTLTYAGSEGKGRVYFTSGFHF